MNIKTEIAKAYADGKSVDCYQNEWFFHAEDKYYKTPSYEEAHRQAVKQILDQILDVVEEFSPLNRDVWDVLFPDWMEILGQVTVNLIVGYPNPFDACVMTNPQGNTEIILDLGLWTRYGEHHDIKSLVLGLLSHELCHVCIRGRYLGPKSGTEHYRSQLDYIAFNEGFAHLLSYQNKTLEKTDWNSPQFAEYKRNSTKRMEEALEEIKEQEQAAFLTEADCGTYYGKFACMCGMFYLASRWKSGGVQALKDVWDLGYDGFAKRSIQEDLQIEG